jgi:hypothetical protein
MKFPAGCLFAIFLAVLIVFPFEVKADGAMEIAAFNDVEMLCHDLPEGEQETAETRREEAREFEDTRLDFEYRIDGQDWKKLASVRSQEKGSKTLRAKAGTHEVSIRWKNRYHADWGIFIEGPFKGAVEDGKTTFWKFNVGFHMVDVALYLEGYGRFYFVFRNRGDATANVFFSIDNGAWITMPAVVRRDVVYAMSALYKNGMHEIRFKTRDPIDGQEVVIGPVQKAIDSNREELIDVTIPLRLPPGDSPYVILYNNP